MEGLAFGVLQVHQVNNNCILRLSTEQQIDDFETGAHNS